MNVSCDLSIVCINNNFNKLNLFLIPSIKNQIDVHYELKIINNFQNQLSGARTAYNDVLEELHGKYVVFVHPDFSFSKNTAFREIIQYCKNLEPFGVVGVAGCSFEAKRTVLTKIKQGIDKRDIGIIISKATEVMSVDECCFVINRVQLVKQPFRNESGWHLYAVEYCLQMLDQNRKNYVIPIEGWHYSDGSSLNADYCKELKTLLMKYKNKYGYINTTVRQWKTDWFTREVFLRYYAMKQNIKSFLLKS